MGLNLPIEQIVLGVLALALLLHLVFHDDKEG